MTKLRTPRQSSMESSRTPIVKLVLKFDGGGRGCGHGCRAGCQPLPAQAVDVTDLNDAWLDSSGNYHTDNLHVVERYTLLNHGTLWYEARMDDPCTRSRGPSACFSIATKNRRRGFSRMNASRIWAPGSATTSPRSPEPSSRIVFRFGFDPPIHRARKSGRKSIRSPFYFHFATARM
jgi:hypothetical protein